MMMPTLLLMIDGRIMMPLWTQNMIVLLSVMDRQTDSRTDTGSLGSDGRIQNVWLLHRNAVLRLKDKRLLC